MLFQEKVHVMSILICTSVDNISIAEYVKYQTSWSHRNHACDKHRTMLAKLGPNIYVEPRENFLAKTKERYQKCIENYIPQGGNTTATRHMSSPMLGCSTSSYNVGNLHPIKTE